MLVHVALTGAHPLLENQKKVITSTSVHTFHVHNALYKIKKIPLEEFPGFMAYHKFISKLHPIVSKSLEGIIVINDDKYDFAHYTELARKHLEVIKKNKISYQTLINTSGTISVISGFLGYFLSYFNPSDEFNHSHLAIGSIISLYCTLLSLAYFGVQYELQEECDTLFTRHINRLEYANTHNP
jgi:hypothetical protein